MFTTFRGRAGRFFRCGLVCICLQTALPPANGTPQWLDIPYVRQVGSGCGAAVVAMVVQYWAREDPAFTSAAGESERINRMLPVSANGMVSGSALKRYLDERGFDAFIFRGELTDLWQHFVKGRPVIVCLGLKGPRAPLHYAVVAGLDGKGVWLNDPARGKLIREELAPFQAAWKATDNWTLLAVPRQSR